MSTSTDIWVEHLSSSAIRIYSAIDTCLYDNCICDPFMDWQPLI